MNSPFRMAAAPAIGTSTRNPLATKSFTARRRPERRLRPGYLLARDDSSSAVSASSSSLFRHNTWETIGDNAHNDLDRLV